jgi:DNA-binding response OmpR family regulator
VSKIGSNQWAQAEGVHEKVDDFGLILVVSGDRGFSQDCGALLEALGHRFTCAFSSGHSIEKFAELEISAALIDYDLPDSDGLRLIKAIANLVQPTQQKIDLILVTALRSFELAVAALRASASDVLEKPLSMAALSSSLLRIRAVRAQEKLDAKVSSELNAVRSDIHQLSYLIERLTGLDKIKDNAVDAKPKEIDADFLHKLMRAEDSRSRVIGGKMMGDPAWNILLDLLLASLEGRKVAVSSACIVAGVATTTALRLVNRMVDDGVLVRIPDSKDGRRHFLGIEPSVEAALKSYLIDLAQL